MALLTFLYACVVFLSAFLLFLVQPMVAKQLLPVLGGSACVWITRLVFFQSALLLGYLYAPWLALQPRRVLCGIVVAAAIGSSMAWATGSLQFYEGSAHPVWTVFKLLGVYIGLPFIV